MAKNFFFRALRHHAPLRQHHKFSANAVGLFEIVADEERRSAVARQRLAKLAFERAAQVRIQRGKWLIEQQRGGLDGQGPRQRHALLLAA